MEETVFYIGEGSPNDKQSKESFALATSIHSSHQHASFRQADCPKHGAVLTGNGQGEKLFIVSRDKALLQVYSWGKEGAEQKIALPEALTCIDICYQPSIDDGKLHKLPNFRVPWLLVGGSSSGRVYIWELASGNLLCVKDCHYQKISTVKFSKCGTFLISGSDDSRCLVWKTIDLILIYDKDQDHLKSVKPFFSIHDNSLPITDFVISDGLINDLKLYTTSKDCTIRIYNIMLKSLLTTFVLSEPIECITKDPANRNLYVGLHNGTIKSIPLYHINSNTNILEAIGGNQKIITIPNDPNLNFTFVHHQQNIVEKSSLLHKSARNQQQEEPSILVTTLEISMDGTSIISGDSLGRVYVADIVTKQVIKTFTPCNSSISYIKVESIPKNIDDSFGKQDKKTRLIPNLKRILTSNDPAEHQLYIEISKEIEDDKEEDDDDFLRWISQKRQENLQFKNLSNINSTVKKVGGAINNNNIEVNSNKLEEIQSKLDKVSAAYTELRNKHEELLKTHTELINKTSST